MLFKTVALTATRVTSAYLAERVLGKVVEERLPNPEAEEITNAPFRIKAETTILYLGGLLAVALMSNYVSDTITDYVEKTFWPEK